MGIKDNQYVIKFTALFQNISPLLIGSSENEILVDKESNRPYIPATSIAGSFRSYVNDNYGANMAEQLFGGHELGSSKLVIYDSETNQFNVDRRPSLKINERTGTGEDGHKFERTFLALGHEFTLELHLYAKDKEEQEKFLQIIYQCFKALKEGHIRLGSNKTSGAGLFAVSSIQQEKYNLYDCHDFFHYLKDTSTKVETITEQIDALELTNEHVVLTLEATICEDHPLLVKGNASNDPSLPDSENIRNSNHDYIIPGTSIKGVLRGQCKKIAHHFGASSLIEEIFGSETSERNEKNLVKGRLFTEDIIVQNPKDQGKYNRIKIDKFTGGTGDGNLLDEQPILGDVKISVFYNASGQNNEKAIIGLLGLAFRDLATGNVAIGSGNNIGRGRLTGKKLTISLKDQEISIDFENNKNSNPVVLNECIQSLYHIS